MKLIQLVVLFALSVLSCNAKGLHRVGKGEMCAYADMSGRTVIPAGKYISSCPKIKDLVMLQSATSDSCFWVDANGVDLYSVYMLGDRLDNLTEGRMRVEKEGKVGFVDKKGRLVVPLRFSVAERFVGKYALVGLPSQAKPCEECPKSSEATDNAKAAPSESLWGVIDKNGKEVKPIAYTMLWSVAMNRIVYVSTTEGFYLSDKGKIVNIKLEK